MQIEMMAWKNVHTHGSGLQSTPTSIHGNTLRARAMSSKRIGESDEELLSSPISSAGRLSESSVWLSGAMDSPICVH